ncbi:MAG: PQQ-dependent sugar dehydrogenase [Planctomycetaceae bacterium]
MKFIHLSIALLAATSPIVAADAPLNTLTDAEARSGWTMLFDGKSFDGWRNFKKDKVSDGWQIEDGSIVRSGKAGDIMTSEKFKYFELQLEYKISKGGNSGLMFHVTEEAGTPWQTGPEVQIQDNVDGHDPQKAGWLYQLYEPRVPNWARIPGSTQKHDDATRPAGEWNHLYLRIGSPKEGGVSEVCINGVSYYKFRLGTKDWNARVAKSKFAKFAGFGKAGEGHICLQDHGNAVAFRNVKIRELGDDAGPKNPIDGELALKGVNAFPNLEFEGWEGTNDDGKPDPLRPMVLTHANDGSGHLFMASQHGMIHVFKNDPETGEAKLFLNIRESVKHFRGRGANEEGLLGFAFHPDYKANGKFYVYYTSSKDRLTSVVSEFTVSSDDKMKADSSSERVVMSIKQPFMNHNGGSMEFGPDGYLYIGMGDGGSRNDPYGNGQKLDTMMGKILRIDVNGTDGDKNYAIPADNPFVGREGVLPEIYSYGWRNVWRLSFDSANGRLWAADVGQDLWEEVNVVEKGGNYGWSVKEASRLFGSKAPFNKEEPIEPVWEYDHQIGKSITGGTVYNGSKIPELKGKYIYADYVTGRIWALGYDAESKKATKNWSLIDGGMPVLAFGQDENGEVYYFIESRSGKSIFRFENK